MKNAYLVGGSRTPVGRYRGALAETRVDDLAALVLNHEVEQAGIDPAAIGDIVLGAANQAGEDNRNLARMAGLLAGFPFTVPGVTVNRLCASGLQAVANAAQAIAVGQYQLALAGGAESMTRAPSVFAKPERAFTGPSEIFDTALGWRLVNPRMNDIDDSQATISLGESTEKLAALKGVTREMADAFALLSQQRAGAAASEGFFARRIVPVPTRGGLVEVDETIRADTTAEGLASLKPSFSRDGVVTAGNASPLSDGASALIVASEESVKEMKLNARARVVDYAVAGVAPSLFGLGPVPAIRALLERNNLSIDDIDVIEINEAFAAQVLACNVDLNIPLEKLNPRGGAISLGHPLGSSGSRILITTLDHMESIGGNYAIVSLCIGVGQGAAMLIQMT